MLIDLRFSNALAGASDKVRVWQIDALREFFWDAPIFGHGMGSYVLQHVRSAELPYAYEVQLLALAAEFGVVGMAIFAFLLLNYYRKAFSFKKGSLSYQFSICLMLVCFLGAGLFNPCLLVSMSAVSYGLLFVLASLGSPGKRSSLQ
jgi:O-antigen ligase